MSGDINVQTFSGKVNINNNLLVGSSHLFVDTVNNRVGITTASPGASLEVNGNVHVVTDVTFGGTLTGDGSGLTNVNSDSGSWVNGTGNVYLSTTTDKVGIGTTSPTVKLQVDSADFSAFKLKRTGSDGGCAMGLYNANDDAWNIGNGASGQFGIYNGSTFGQEFSITSSGNVGIGTTSASAKLDVNGALHLRSDITRSSHSTGYFVGSYNNVGANSYKTNPIYTIGSNYKPSDDSLGNMYGIGYSHGNFTGYLTNGWGLYVASDGDVRIGLNAQHGHIKNSGNMYCGGSVYVSNKSVGIRSVTGQYGTIQTTGSPTGGWAGYSIEGRYVFMSSSNSSVGCYNDIDNRWIWYHYKASRTDWYDGMKIFGIEGTRDYSNADSDWWKNGGSIQADPPNLNFGLFCTYAIRAPQYVAYSDRRIKKDIVEIDDTLALDKLRLLKPTTYRYIDKTRNTTDRVIGFIAQEVAEVLPDAVSTETQVIPNIQLEASVKKVGENEFELTLKEPHLVTAGTKLELRTPNINRIEAEVISVINDTTFTILADETTKMDDMERVWVFGEYVDDFHHLDKMAIFTIATAAVQEVDRQQQADKTRIVELEIQIQTEKERTQQIEADLQITQTQLETTRTELEHALEAEKIKTKNLESRIAFLETAVASLIS